jgi:hypothetical protein
MRYNLWKRKGRGKALETKFQPPPTMILMSMFRLQKNNSINIIYTLKDVIKNRSELKKIFFNFLNL